MLEPSTHSTLERLKRELAHLKTENLLRHLDVTPGINLCSNDYLGLSRDSRLRRALTTALADAEKFCSTGSRLLSGNSSQWEALESEFAEFMGTEAALFFNSGYAANIGLLSSVLRPEDTVFSDSSNHASIIDGIRLSHAHKVIFPHLDLDFLEDALRGADTVGEKFIVVESVFSMDGDRAPLGELMSLADRYGAGLIVDEAHAVGVFGSQGRGLVHSAGRTRTVVATVHTCGKALAAVGAFVCCSEVFK